MRNITVRKNNVIVFHDIVEHSSKIGYEVNKLWNEIKYKNIRKF